MDVGLGAIKKRKSKTSSQTGSKKPKLDLKECRIDDKFLEQTLEYLEVKKQLPVVTTNEVIDEKLQEQTCPIFESLVDTGCLMTYAQDSSIQNLEAVLTHYDLNKDQYNTILRSLIPPNLKIFGTTTELQYTTTHFSPLFELALLSKNNIFVNSNIQILQMLNTKIVSDSIVDSLQEFQVDGILAQQYFNYTITKIIREDNYDNSFLHFNHPDFLRVVLGMRLALSMNIRILVKSVLNHNIHDKLFILGMTTDCKQTNLYCMHATIGQDLYISYTLYTLGSFRHEILNERAQLVDIILKSFSIPNPSELENYLKYSKPSKKDPPTEKNPNTTLTISNMIITLHTKVSERLCQTTKSLWKGSLMIYNSSKCWNVYVKQVESNSNDFYISLLSFLTLYINRTNEEIILFEGETVETISQEIEIVRIMSDLLIQLHFLKQLGFLHNDLKPQNIVKYENHYFIIDYGLSIKYYSIDGNVCEDEKQTVITSTSGSPFYDSPEKKKYGAVSPQSDLFSLGCSIQEIIKISDNNEFNLLMEDLISHMTKSNIDERWTVQQCLHFLKSKYPNETQRSFTFFKEKDRFRSQLEENPVNDWEY